MKGKPWPVICRAAAGILKDFEVGAQATPAIREAAAENGALAVMALIEWIGAKPYDLDNPFQADLYRTCARPEYRQSGRAYVRELGGELALPSAMTTWARNHPTDVG